jgi:hypothetical protein
MSAGDIMPFENANASKMGGALKFYVAAGATGADGTTSRIKAGEPVAKTAGAAGVIALVTNGPTASCRIVGVAQNTSTETASVSGTVDVIPAAPGQLWLIKPNVAATWNTQAKYNALVGSRVLLDNTTGTYTILAADGAGYGCIVEYLDIARYPGLVAFSFSKLVDYANV